MVIFTCAAFGVFFRKTKAMSKSVRTQVQHRSSKTGYWVTEKYADRHPDTTEREVIKHPAPKP